MAEEDERQGTPTLVEELGAVCRGLEKVAQQFAPSMKWHGRMHLKLVEPPHLVTLHRPGRLTL